MHTRCASQAQNSWDASSTPLSAPFCASFETESLCLSSVSSVSLSSAALLPPLFTRITAQEYVPTKRESRARNTSERRERRFSQRGGDGDSKNSRKGLGFQQPPSDSEEHLVCRFLTRTLFSGDCFKFSDLLGESRVLP